MNEIMQGADPFFCKGSDKGVLLLHGFTGSPQSLRGLAEYIAQSGFTVSLPLLPGHGTKKEDMLNLTYQDWLKAARDELCRLREVCRAVAVGGLSMGGTLTCDLLIHEPDIKCGFVINPLLEPPDDSVLNLLNSLVESGQRFTLGIGSDIKKEGASELCYDATPVKEVLSLIKAASELRNELLKIKVPICVLVSKEDHVVNPQSAQTLAQAIGALAELSYLENSYHVATLDNDAELINDKVLSHLNRWL